VRPKIAYFGFVRPQKGIEQLVEAFAMFGRGELLITGTGVREGEHVPIRPVPGLTFINRFIPDEEIREILKDTDIIALPYTDRFPHISGMAHSLAGYGVPMLLSNHLVFADFTDGVDCVKVDPTPEGILAGIRKLVDRPGLYARVAANAKARSVTESWKVTSALFVSEAAKRR
jgi:glycosyltransferase involved in cell wall biosynthesis